jgi:hypothetical protein
MYNVTLWRVRVTIVAMEMQQYPLCVLLKYMALSTKQKKKLRKSVVVGIHVAGKSEINFGHHAKCPRVLSVF